MGQKGPGLFLGLKKQNRPVSFISFFNIIYRGIKMFCRRYCRHWQYGDITIDELKNKLSQGAILIDVRSNQEYREGHIQGAVNIPDFEIRNRVEREIPKKNQLIVLYCQYGGRSKNAMNYMKNKGYTNVYNLHGGLDIL